MAVSLSNIRDYGLVAYLKHRGYQCKRNPDGRSYQVDLSVQAFEIELSLYRMDIKPLLDAIRQIKKEVSKGPHA